MVRVHRQRRATDAAPTLRPEDLHSGAQISQILFAQACLKTTMAIQPAKNIWVAAGDGDLSRVRELVEHHGLSPNVPDAFTYTPM